MNMIRERDERKSLGLSGAQQQRWNYIVDKKGADYLLTAVAKAFKTNNGKQFDKFLQDLFIKLYDDYKAAQKMRKGNDASSDDELEVID